MAKPTEELTIPASRDARCPLDLSEVPVAGGPSPRKSGAASVRRSRDLGR
jgi:hypothetical protein